MDNYPKSSCTCYRREKQVDNRSGLPTNMSVANCAFPKCYDAQVFRQDNEPRLLSGIETLNPQALSQKRAPHFYEINGKIAGCPSKQFGSRDPRLISAGHMGQVQTLDKIPSTSEITFGQLLTDKRLDKYGQNYKTYSDINAGDVTYYVDKEDSDPYFTPNFVTTAKTTGVLYQDPMGAMKPQYIREPITDDNPIGNKRDNYEGCLSWMQDSLSHRQDLTSLQMRKMNQQRYEPRWYGEKYQ